MQDAVPKAKAKKPEEEVRGCLASTWSADSACVPPPSTLVCDGLALQALVVCLSPGPLVCTTHPTNHRPNRRRRRRTTMP